MLFSLFNTKHTTFCIQNKLVFSNVKGVNMEIKKHYYTIEEVMEMLDIGKSAIYNMLRTGEMQLNVIDFVNIG